MLSYIIRRSFWLVIILIGVSILTFAVSHLIPADPVRYAVGLEASKEEVEQVRHELGLDQPPLIQYFRYVRNLLHGDFGYSLATRRQVGRDLSEYFPATFELVIFAFGLMILIGVPAGVISAVSRGSALDSLTRIPTILGTGIPLFWLGLIGQFFFYYKWGVLPVGGQIPQTIRELPHVTGLLVLDALLLGNFTLLGQAVLHLVMPVTVLSLGRVAIITRLARASVLEVLRQDFIRTAQAKGLSRFVVLFRHSLKPALIPILTEMGLQFGWLLGGTVLVEIIFAWPGIGRYAFTAIQFHDLQAVMGVTLILTLFKVLANLIVDVLYALADPRIQY